jgi:hypothetical protein
MSHLKKYLSVVSVSLGSSTRDHQTIIRLNNKDIVVKRIGTDGDLAKAEQLFKSLDGKIDAFGLGGTDLGLLVRNNWFPLHSILHIIKNIKKTPIVDGTGLKTLLEKETAKVLVENIDVKLIKDNKKVLIMSGCDRWGLQKSFKEAGFTNIFGDLIFGINLPIRLKTEQQIVFFANLLLPLFSRLPFKWIYPLGEKQHYNTPRAERLFNSVSIIAGDCHYIRRYMPLQLKASIIVTNTTTAEDIEAFKKAGIKYLVTTTPVYDQRSYGTNVMEAAFVAAYNIGEYVCYKNRAKYFDLLGKAIIETNIRPQFISLI